jgi:hypothetical protein
MSCTQTFWPSATMSCGKGSVYSPAELARRLQRDGALRALACPAVGLVQLLHEAAAQAVEALGEALELGAGVGGGGAAGGQREGEHQRGKTTHAGPSVGGDGRAR